MAADWYFKLGPIVAGPFAKDEFSARVAAGEIRAKTLVRKGAGGNWVPAAMVEGLLTPVTPVPKQDEASAPSTEPEAVPSPAAQTSEVQSVPVNPAALGISRRLVVGLLAFTAIGLLSIGSLTVWKIFQPSTPTAPSPDVAGEQIALLTAEIEKFRAQVKQLDERKDQRVPAPGNAPEPELPELEPEQDVAQHEPVEPVEDGPREIPEDLLKQIEAAKQARAEVRRKEQARVLQRIYEQRAILTDRWEIARGKLQQIQSAMSAAETDLARCEEEGTQLRQNAVVLQRQIKEVEETLLFEKDSSRRAQLQALLTSGTAAYAQGQARYLALDAAAAQARLNYGRLQPQEQAATADVNQLYQQADRLRTEWLNATEAFGKLVNGDYAAAVVDFSEWIVLEPTSAIPYAARGLAHHYGGRPDLARVDFQQASKIDPALTARMIRDFQDFLNGVQPQQNAKLKQKGRKRK